MPAVTYKTEYYVRLPKQMVYVQESEASSLTFSFFFDNAKCFTKDDAVKLAKKYDLEIEERTITTTVDTQIKTFKALEV